MKCEIGSTIIPFSCKEIIYNDPHKPFSSQFYLFNRLHALISIAYPRADHKSQLSHCASPLNVVSSVLFIFYLFKYEIWSENVWLKFPHKYIGSTRIGRRPFDPGQKHTLPNQTYISCSGLLAAQWFILASFARTQRQQWNESDNKNVPNSIQLCRVIHLWIDHSCNGAQAAPVENQNHIMSHPENI